MPESETETGTPVVNQGTETPPASQDKATETPKPAGPSEEYKGMQKQLAKMEKRLDDKLSRFEGLFDELHIQAEANQALGMDLAGNQLGAESGNVLSNFQKYQTTAQQRRAQREAEDYNKRVAAVQSELKAELQEAGFDPDGPDFKDVWTDKDALEAYKKLVRGVTQRAKEYKGKIPEATALDKMVQDKVAEELVKLGIHRTDMSPGKGISAISKKNLSDLSSQLANENDREKRKEIMAKINAAWKSGNIT